MDAAVHAVGIVHTDLVLAYPDTHFSLFLVDYLFTLPCFFRTLPKRREVAQAESSDNEEVPAMSSAEDQLTDLLIRKMMDRGLVFSQNGPAKKIRTSATVTNQTVEASTAASSDRPATGSLGPSTSSSTTTANPLSSEMSNPLLSAPGFLIHFEMNRPREAREWAPWLDPSHQMLHPET
ncbi:hypothetical protein SNE40_023751 [Patella caerulea]|uniref:Uncharacterized protein n=1 Tax=Patella caerulea TaxID=87958 RepID=A0AAN8IX55_PATCE